MNAKRRRYGTILADPPWPEYGGGQVVRGAQRHYPLMRLTEIALLPVSRWAAPNAHLYLWVTNNYLYEGLQIMRTWDFRYITCITWMKDRMGLGQYFRGMTEHCLFGVRGRVPYQQLPNGKRAQGRTGFLAPRTEHSVKPEQVHLWAEMISPEPRLELFARRLRPGWSAWGNDPAVEGDYDRLSCP